MIRVIGTNRQEIPVVQDTLSITYSVELSSCKFVGSTFAQAHAIPFNKYPPQKSISCVSIHGVSPNILLHPPRQLIDIIFAFTPQDTLN